MSEFVTGNNPEFEREANLDWVIREQFPDDVLQKYGVTEESDEI